MNKKRITTAKHIVAFAVLFLLIASIGLHFSANYIVDQLLYSNESIATDIALLVSNNFTITDAEASYMKSLTFNEMEVDPINYRLMNVGNGVKLDMNISNVYIVVPLPDYEYVYCPDKESADFLGYTMDTPLDGMWLLNGLIDPEGHFLPKERDDIYRYTKLDKTQLEGIQNKKALGSYTSDAWGRFITGYAPVYSEEGNFIGLLGIDMSPDYYQSSAQNMLLLLLGLFFAVTVILLALFILFYMRYIKARDGQLQFAFYSRMSHDMRTPMTGILGIAEMSRAEENPDILR